MFFGDPLTGENGVCLQKQDWQREKKMLELINLKATSESWVYFYENKYCRFDMKPFFTFFWTFFLHIFALYY